MSDAVAILSEAVTRLIEAQMPWGEWGAIGESAEARYAQRMRPEYRYSPIPKANVFRTIVSVEALRGFAFANDNVTKALGWLNSRLMKCGSSKKTGSQWTAHIPIPAGTGLWLSTPDMVKMKDIRHTAQALCELLWAKGNYCPTDWLPNTVNGILRSSRSCGLWGNLMESERPSEFASACCLAFLGVAIASDALPNSCVKAARKAICRGSEALCDKLQTILSTGDRIKLEEAGRSLWILGKAGLVLEYATIVPRISDAIDRVDGNAIQDFCARIRLACAAHAHRSTVDTNWIADGFGRHCEILHPPDHGFVILALQGAAAGDLESVRPIVTPVTVKRRSEVMHAALLERLEVFEWLITTDNTVALKEIWDEQLSYVRKLVADDTLSGFHDVEQNCLREGAANLENLRKSLEKLEQMRKAILVRQHDGIQPHWPLVHRTVSEAVNHLENDSEAAFVARILLTMHELWHFHTTTPQSFQLERESQLRSLVALELSVAGYILRAFEAECAAGKTDLVIKDWLSNQEAILEFKLVKTGAEFTDLYWEQIDSEVIADAIDRYQKRIEKTADSGASQLDRYSGPAIRLVCVGCNVPVDSAKLTLKDFIVRPVKEEARGDLKILIVKVALYFKFLMGSTFFSQIGAK